MSNAYSDRSDRGAIPREGRNAAALGLADWLCLAAAPVFAMMALLTGVLGGGSPDVMCSMSTSSPLGGMVPMYLLMTAFHSAPWLRLISGRRRTIRPESPKAEMPSCASRSARHARFSLTKL
jgi:hypothetical protein